jgi:hypothetical protein
LTLSQIHFDDEQARDHEHAKTKKFGHVLTNIVDYKVTMQLDPTFASVTQAATTTRSG